MRGLFTWVLVAVLPLSGCLLSDDDSPAACVRAVEQDLDAGRWNTALDRLESGACRRGMAEPERQLDRGAAYIGRAGYELGDLVNTVLDDVEDEDRPTEIRLLEELGNLGVSPGGLRDLDLSLLSHEAAVSTLVIDGAPASAEQACRSARTDALSSAQRDACFLAGLFSFARFSRVLSLLLEDDTLAWTQRASLSCDEDRNSSGVPDAAEATACAILAREQGERAGDLCRAATAERGAVRWEPLPDNQRVGFRIDGETFARMRPVRIRVEPGASCTGRSEKVRYRLIARSDTDPTLAVTEGLCRSDVRRSCDQADPGSDCWPCPVARADGSGSLTVSNALLAPLNREAELMLFTLPDVDEERVVSRLERTRARLCKRASGSGRACGQRADGATRVREAALGAYFER